MKVCIVHNSYGRFSGEEAVVRDHKAVFEAKGCEVVEFRRSSEELTGPFGAAKGFFCGLYQPLARRAFGTFLEREKPSIVHIHNLYPLINPCILPEARRRGIPVVMTMHNFRLFCPSGLFAVDNAICEACAKENSVWPCVRKNCLHSWMKSLGYALRTLVAQRAGWYDYCVDRYLCLTEFQRRKLVSYGLDASRIRMVPNFIDSSWLVRAQQAERSCGKYVAYMGRLSEEKGIDVLLEAARKLPDIPFRLAGNGGERYREAAPSNVDFAGYVEGDAQLDFLRNARLHVMTSRCYENFPTSLLQGMSLGIPEIVPSHGGMPDIIGGGGMTFDMTAEGLAETVGKIWNDALLWKRYSIGARKKMESYTADCFWKQWKTAVEELGVVCPQG